MAVDEWGQGQGIDNMFRSLSFSVVIGVFSMLMPAIVCAQSFGDILKDAVSRRATELAEEAIDKGLDTAEEAVQCVVTDQQCIERAQQAGDEVVLINNEGKPLPPDGQPQGSVATSTATETAAPIDDRPIVGAGVPAAARVAAVERTASWETQTGFRDAGKIVVANGVVVTGNIDGGGGTFAYDAATGKLLWKAPGHLRVGPVTEGSRVYTANTDVGVSAFDLRTGQVAWTAADAETVVSADLLSYDGRMFVVGDHGKMRVYEAASGKALWAHEYSPGGYLAYCPTTPVGADGLVYYGGGELNPPGQVSLWALNAVTGEVVWSKAIKPGRDDRYGSCVTPVVIDAGVVAVVSGHVMFGLDARTGVERWRRPVERRIDGVAEPRPLSAPFLHGNRVYAIFEEGLIGWDIASGRQQFEFVGNFPAGNYYRILAFAEDTVYFIANLEQPKTRGNRGGFLYAVDLATAQVQWKHRVNREKPYYSDWSTTHFALDGSAVYYENAGFLAKVSR